MYLKDIVGEQSIQIFVLFVPTLGAEERHVQPAMKFITGSNVHYYWDPGETLMKLFGSSIGFDINLWDFWAIYNKKVSWVEEVPPQPDFWQHQLRGLPQEKRLDAEEFVQKISAAREI